MHILSTIPTPSRPALPPALYLLATANALDDAARLNREWLCASRGLAASAAVRLMVTLQAERLEAAAKVIREELMQPR